MYRKSLSDLEDEASQVAWCLKNAENQLKYDSKRNAFLETLDKLSREGCLNYQQNLSFLKIFTKSIPDIDYKEMSFWRDFNTNTRDKSPLTTNQIDSAYLVKPVCETINSLLINIELVDPENSLTSYETRVYAEDQNLPFPEYPGNRRNYNVVVDNILETIDSSFTGETKQVKLMSLAKYFRFMQNGTNYELRNFDLQKYRLEDDRLQISSSIGTHGNSVLIRSKNPDDSVTALFNDNLRFLNHKNYEQLSTVEFVDCYYGRDGAFAKHYRSFLGI